MNLLLIFLDPQAPATQWATLLTPLFAAMVVLIQVYTETMRQKDKTAEKERVDRQAVVDDQRHNMVQSLATQALLASTKNTQILENHDKTLGAIKDHLTGEALLVDPGPSPEAVVLDQIRALVTPSATPMAPTVAK